MDQCRTETGWVRSSSSDQICNTRSGLVPSNLGPAQSVPTPTIIESLLGMLTIKLNDENFIKWSFQFCSVLRGYDLLDHFIGESVCPPKFVLTPDLGVTNEISTAYKEWVKIDMTLLSLLIATLSDDAIEHVVGCKTSSEAWTALQDRYMSVSKASVNHLKAELYTMQKGGDSIDKYLLRLKGIKDQLQAAGEKVYDNDLIIAALTARESPITFKEFRAQLIGAEKNIETRVQSLVHGMAAMYVNGNSPLGMNSSSSSDSYVAGSAPASLSFGYGFTGVNSQMLSPSYSQGGYQSTGSGPNAGNGLSSTSNTGGTPGQRYFSNSSNSYRPKGNGGYKQRFNGSNKGNSWQSWSGNTSNRFEPIPECQICSRKGHVAVTCLYRNDNGQPIQECQICGKKGHIALNCRHRSNYAYQGTPPLTSLSANYANQAFSPQNPPYVPLFPTASQYASPHNFSQFTQYPSQTVAVPYSSQNVAVPYSSQIMPQGNLTSHQPFFPAMTAQNSNESAGGESWIVDTGASHHMSPDVTVLTRAAPYEGTEKIVVGNGEGQGNRGDSTSRKE
ncbi:unnamed protein product [Malus baccata var. baccata]